MHVASTMIFEGPTPSYDEFREHVESRLHLVPRFRQKLRFVPFDQGRPLWVDDPHLNLRYHIRHTALPSPGSDEQLRTLAARIFSQRLDRSKPLWEMWLIDGLQDGRFAIIGKSHHALVDGISGVDITTVLFDTSPDPAPVHEPREEWVPEPEPTGAQLLAESLLERATDPAEAIRTVRAAMRRPEQLLAALREALAAIGSIAGVSMAAPASPLNVPIGPHRRFRTVRADLDQFKQVKNRFGGTVNDVVLTVVAGALRRYLRGQGHTTAEQELRAMVPISVREDEERGALGNRVTAMMAVLPVWCEDPVERLDIVRSRMGDLKGSGQAVGARLITELADFAPATILGQAARLQARQRLFNLVVTNMPGPQLPLYVLGRRLESVFPMVPLVANQALCVGIISYDGQLDFGLIGDYEAMRDLDDFKECLEAEIRELTLRAAGTARRVPSARPGTKARERARSGA
jgi:WS/DGAT/MGAT family acyltransferase